MQNLLTTIEQLVSKTDKKLQETTFPKIIENLSDLIIEIQKSQNVNSQSLPNPPSPTSTKSTSSSKKF
jgi:hypothetical protein